MLLICPACTKRYHVAPGSIPASGRAVKCASCHHSWRAEGLSETPDGAARPARMPAGPKGQPRRFARAASPAADAAPVASAMAGGSAGRAFSRPLRSGGAVLAKMSESYADEAADLLPSEDALPASDSDWETAAPAFDMDLDSRISDAMASPQISRLVDQERTGNIMQGPDATLGATFDASLGASLGKASRSGAVMGRFPHTDHGGGPMPDARSGATARPRGPLLRAARLVTKLAGAIAGGLEAALSGLDRMRRDEAEPIRTPGDRKVTEWRVAQLRRARRRMTPAKAMGWLALCAMVAGIAYGIGFHRDIVAAHWPQAGEMYAALSGAEPGPVLTIDRVEHRYAVSTQGPVVELSGFLRHDGDTPLAAPVLRADALDAAGSVLSSWAFRLDGPARLSPMSETPFRTRALTPTGTRDIDLSVMSAQEIAVLAPELSSRVISATGVADGDGFFMQKTTSGWDAGAETLAVRAPGAQD